MTLALFLDTETDRLVDSKRPPEDPAQPNLVQLGLVLIELETERTISEVSLIVKPDGFSIPDNAANVHGITTSLAARVGVPLRIVVAVFTNLRSVAHVMVSHNSDFDQLVMKTAIYRSGANPKSPGPTSIRCTKLIGASIVNLPPTERMLRAGFNKPKDPTLGELYSFLFHEEIDGAHDALVDARACAMCYLELLRRGNVPF